jgi:aminopeptidase YwaD
VIDSNPGISEGIQWQQGDHSIFVQYGVAAIAISSEWFINNINDQEITHTPKDNPSIADCRKLVEISQAINALIRKL